MKCRVYQNLAFLARSIIRAVAGATNYPSCSINGKDLSDSLSRQIHSSNIGAGLCYKIKNARLMAG